MKWRNHEKMPKRKVKLVKRPSSPTKRMKQIRDKVVPEINTVLRAHQKMRDKATQGWSPRNKPSFPSFIKYTHSPSRKMVFGVKVKAKNARKASISVYRMNNDARHGKLATKVRHAFMESGFMSKTQPHQFGLFGKGGKPLYVSKNFKGNGIEARLWDETANSILRPRMRSYIIKGYQKGFKAVQGKTVNG